VWSVIGVVAVIWLLAFVGSARAQLVLPKLHPLDDDALGRDEPRLGVVIPARDEQDAIETTVRSLLAQRGVAVEIVIVNDGSSDETGAIADRLAAEDARVTVLHDPEIPEGWLGKTNAMQQGAARLTTERVLFCDADITFDPRALKSALSLAEERDLTLLSCFPRFRWVTIFEHAMLGAFFLALGQFGSKHINDPRFVDRSAAAGAFLLVKRADYEAIGGHEPVRQALIDDVALARVLKHRFAKCEVHLAPELLSIRMYPGNKAALFSVEKNVLASFGPRWWAILTVPFLFAPVYFGAPAGVVVGAATQDVPLLAAAATLFLFQYATLYVLRSWHAFSPLRALAFPLVHVILTVCVARASWRYVTKRSIHWRGRTTRIDGFGP
jgi:glycosyltransferase involved in cell wall biosynthesis